MTRKSSATTTKNRREVQDARTLSIDVGGTGLKASVLDRRGRLLVERVRVETPVGAHPKEYLALLEKLVAPLPPYHRISVGFPGVVRGGVVRTAPNLGHEAWRGFDLGTALTRRLGRPTRVINDADMQGLAVIAGKGMEMVVTLGTGFGTAIFQDGRLGPHLEISHHPFRKGETYDQHLGERARKKVGTRKWTERVEKAIDQLRTLTHFDRLYLGGGNAKRLDIKLPRDVKIVSNQAGIAGGVHLWEQD